MTGIQHSTVPPGNQARVAWQALPGRERHREENAAFQETGSAIDLLILNPYEPEPCRVEVAHPLQPRCGVEISPGSNEHGFSLTKALASVALAVISLLQPTTAAATTGSKITSGLLLNIKDDTVTGEAAKTLVSRPLSTPVSPSAAGMMTPSADKGRYVSSTHDWHYVSDDAYREFEPIPVKVTRKVPSRLSRGKRTRYTTRRVVEDIAPLIQSAARRHGISPYLIKAVIAKESSFLPGAHSSKGACGLMQVLPSTARMMGVQDYWSVEGNIEAGTSYLRTLLDEFQDLRTALSAYNTGPNNVRKHDNTPPEYTFDYINRILMFLEFNTGPV